jgi:hypothetical protein
LRGLGSDRSGEALKRYSTQNPKDDMGVRKF